MIPAADDPLLSCNSSPATDDPLLSCNSSPQQRSSTSPAAAETRTHRGHRPLPPSPPPSTPSSHHLLRSHPTSTEPLPWRPSYRPSLPPRAQNPSPRPWRPYAPQEGHDLQHVDMGGRHGRGRDGRRALALSYLRRRRRRRRVIWIPPPLLSSREEREIIGRPDPRRAEETDGAPLLFVKVRSKQAGARTHAWVTNPPYHKRPRSAAPWTRGADTPLCHAQPPLPPSAGPPMSADPCVATCKQIK